MQIFCLAMLDQLRNNFFCRNLKFWLQIFLRASESIVSGYISHINLYIFSFHHEKLLCRWSYRGRLFFIGNKKL